MKKLIVMGVIFLALGSFVYFYEIQGQEEREQAEALEESLFRLSGQEAVTGLTIEAPGQPAVVLAREAETWMVKEPVSSVADESAVTALLSRVADAKRERVLEDPGDLGQFGLEGEVTRLIVNSEDKAQTLLLGGKAFESSQMYARFADASDVLITSNLLRGAIEKDLKDWRDRSLLRFERSNLESMELIFGSKKLAFEKRDSDWYLIEPVEEKADTSTVSSVLTTLSSATIDEFVVESTDNPSQYGLDEPAGTVRVREAGADAWQSLEIGGEADEGLFARDPARPPVLRVTASLLTDLDKDIFEFRDKDIVDVDQSTIARLRLQRAEDSLSIRHEDFKWIIESPEEQKDQEALAYKFWYPIDDMEFDTIEETDSADFTEPDITLTLELQDGSQAVFLFVEDEEAYRARRQSDGRHGRISKETFDKLLVAAEELG